MGDTLFVANYGNGTVGAYNANTGAVINASFVSGLVNPSGVVVKVKK
jgi:outer membrane protein assembly factor BamB